MRVALGNLEEPEQGWAHIGLQESLPYLCRNAPHFRDALASIASTAGRHKLCNPIPNNAKDVVTTASAITYSVIPCPYHDRSFSHLLDVHAQVCCGMLSCTRMA